MKNKLVLESKLSFIPHFADIVHIRTFLPSRTLPELLHTTTAMSFHTRRKAPRLSGRQTRKFKRPVTVPPSSVSDSGDDGDGDEEYEYSSCGSEESSEKSIHPDSAGEKHPFSTSNHSAGDTHPLPLAQQHQQFLFDSQFRNIGGAWDGSPRPVPYDYEGEYWERERVVLISNSIYFLC
jgi:hypothetical protein